MVHSLCAYLVVCLAISILHITRSAAQGTRVILIFFDTAMLTLLTAGASAATAVVYLAHKGHTRANWFAICQQFNSCKHISGSLIVSVRAIDRCDCVRILSVFNWYAMNGFYCLWCAME
ncbi:hypothetical protein CsSME_00004206 [Camellia sinensis var. sinensis]